jgi:mRNA interferase MazF
MGRFIKGDIVVLPFPFSDLSSNKRRPALVLIDGIGDDIVLCQITSKSVRDEKSIVLETDDVENGALKDISNVRPNKLFTADEKIVLYKLGNLSKEKLDEVIDAIIGMFRA